MWILKNKDTHEVVDPRVDDFALSPSDLGDFDTWDDALSQASEVDLVEGFEAVDVSPGYRSLVDAIDRSRSHNESVAVQMECNHNELLSLLGLLWGDNFDSGIENDGTLDVWGWLPQTPEGKMEWRLKVSLA